MIFNMVHFNVVSTDGDLYSSDDIVSIIPSSSGNEVEISNGNIVTLDIEGWHLFWLINRYEFWRPLIRSVKKLF